MATFISGTGSSKRTLATGKQVLDVAIVDGSGNQVTSFSGSGGTSATDGAAFTASTTAGTPIIGAYESSPTTVADNKVGIVGITTNRELKVSVTSGGTAGVQYTEADTDSTITGTAIMWEDTSDTLRSVSAAKPLPIGDAGGSLTVDGTFWQATQPISGTVTANAGTNLNTSTLALEAGGNLATIAALSKAEDAAHASTNTGIMALAVRNATVTDLSAGNTDGDYEPLQVSAAGRLWASATIDAALPAGANAIGKLAANSGVDIGDVDVTSVPADPFGANADAASATGSISAKLRFIAGTGIPVTGTVTVASHAVTNAGTFAVQDAGTTAHDGAGAAVNPVAIGAYASAAVPTDVSADTDIVRVWALRSGAVAIQETYAGVLGLAGNGVAGTGVQRVTIASDSTGNIATIGTSVTPGTASTNLGKLEDGAHASGDVGVMTLAVRKATAAADLSAGNTDGDYEPLQVDASGNLWTHPYDTIAHDAVDAGNGIKVTYKAVASPKGLTLVSAADRSDVYCDVDGLQIVKTATSFQDLISASQSVTDTTSTAVTGFTAVASTKNFITSVTVHNAHATTNGFLKLQDGSGGTTMWVFPLPATGGATHNFDPPLKQPTAATALYFASSASISTIYVSVNGFQSKAY